MRYYEYSPDCTIAGVGSTLTLDHLQGIDHYDEPLSWMWGPIDFHKFKEDAPYDEDGDFPSFHDDPSLPICSGRAWDVLSPLIGRRCEALPIIYPGGKRYYLIHVMETIDCLDVEHSEGVERFSDGGVMDVERYCLKTSMLAGKHIFKLPRETLGRLLVDDVFRDAVEKNGLTGLEFVALPTVAPPADDSQHRRR